MSQHVRCGCSSGRCAASTPLAIAVIVLNALRCFVGVECSGVGAAVIAARSPNERREIARLKRMIPDRDWTDLLFRWRLRPMGSAIGTLLRTMPSDCRRAARLARFLSRRYGVFRALRALELVAYYRRYVDLFAARPFQLAVMSSHSNPHGIALNLAATRFGVPVVLITHGMPVRPIARLDSPWPSWSARHPATSTRRRDAGWTTS